MFFLRYWVPIFMDNPTSLFYVLLLVCSLCKQPVMLSTLESIMMEASHSVIVCANLGTSLWNPCSCWLKRNIYNGKQSLLRLKTHFGSLIKINFAAGRLSTASQACLEFTLLAFWSLAVPESKGPFGPRLQLGSCWKH